MFKLGRNGLARLKSCRPHQHLVVSTGLFLGVLQFGFAKPTDNSRKTNCNPLKSFQALVGPADQSSGIGEGAMFFSEGALPVDEHLFHADCRLSGRLIGCRDL